MHVGGNECWTKGGGGVSIDGFLHPGVGSTQGHEPRCTDDLVGLGHVMSSVRPAFDEFTNNRDISFFI